MDNPAEQDRTLTEQAIKPEPELTLAQELERMKDHAPKTSELLAKAAKFFGG